MMKRKFGKYLLATGLIIAVILAVVPSVSAFEGAVIGITAHVEGQPQCLTTRTQGFWGTHESFTSAIFAEFFPGGMHIGVAPHKGIITNIEADGQSELFGAFWANISHTTTKDKRSDLDQSRMQMLQQLVAAKLNAAAFGASPATLALLSDADAAYAGTNGALIDSLEGHANYR
jgi:hypothetical protein